MLWPSVLDQVHVAAQSANPSTQDLVGGGRGPPEADPSQVGAVWGPWSLAGQRRCETLRPDPGSVELDPASGPASHYSSGLQIQDCH